MGSVTFDNQRNVTQPLDGGDYVMLCPLSGPEGQHYKLGQLEEFEIE